MTSGTEMAEEAGRGDGSESNVHRENRVHRAALSAVAEPGHLAVARRVRKQGPEAAWRAIRAGDSSLDPTGALRRRAELIAGAQLLRHAQRLGVRFVCPGDPEWPSALTALEDTLDGAEEPVPPPWGLWVRGRLDLPTATARAVAVVGARAATPYGERVAADLGADLALSGWAVISGAAFGIDAAAHRGCLAMGGTTVAVLAGGVDVPYPRGHAGLLERIAAHGALVSELPLGTRPMRSRFLSRNRLIAGLAAGTVVVEAAVRSGALSTATWTERLSRSVLAVPGPVTSSLSAGCHALMRDRHAILVTDAREVVDAVGVLGRDAVLPRRGRERPLDHVPAELRAVREAMPGERSCDVRELVAATGYLPGQVRAALIALSAGGWVRRDGDRWRLGSGRRSGR